MSEDHVLDSFKELVDYDDAARLLSHICPDSIRNKSENDLDSPESFACLLRRNPLLFDQLKRALPLRNFEPVWEACITYTQPRYFKRMHVIPDILSQMSYKLPDLVNGRIETPFWKLSAMSQVEDREEDSYAIVKKFDLHQMMQKDTIPPMLFYDLGCFSNKNHSTQYERLQKLFRSELIFVLKVTGKFVWVMLRTVGRSMQPEEVDMGSEFELLTESKLFSYPTNDATIPEKRLKETLEGLPNTLAPAGSFPVLRVLASFPMQLSLSRGIAQKIDRGPMAVLNLQHMQQVTDSFSHDDIIEGLISSMHEKRSSYDDDAFSPVDTAPKPVPKLRKGKRKDPAEETLTAPPKGDSSKPLNRLIRSIPRHMSRPSTPILETESGPSFSTGDDEVADGQLRSPPPVPKHPKKARSVIKKGADTDILPRRRSTRNLKKKDNVKV